MAKLRLFFVFFSWLTILAVVGAIFVYVRYYRVRPIPITRHAVLPIPHLQQDNSVSLTMPNGNLVASVGQFSSQISAILYFNYLQSLKPLAGTKILIRPPHRPRHPNFQLYVALPNNYLTQSNRLLQLAIKGQIPGFHLSSPPTSQIKDWSRQTRVLQKVYQRKTEKPLLQFPRKLLISAVAQFILFKSRTDPRAQLNLVPPAKLLSPHDARLFATDMVDVASFYHIPLSMFIGIGAMENNFLDVRGDLHHSVWKRHWQPGDVLLRRRHGWILVKDFARGPWQITQSTLRVAHRLYLRDTRDYSLLPAYLRPHQKLDLNHISTPVLTTYAGLLISNLLSNFQGNRYKAAGAYNGGDGNPNMQYAQGVFLVARYAHRVIAHAVRQQEIRELLQNSPPPSTPPTPPGKLQPPYVAWLRQFPMQRQPALSQAH
jgi:hypothetical protein